MSELAIREPDAIVARAPVAVSERDVVDGWIKVVGEIAKLADWIADTDFVPKSLRNRPAAIAACMLTGREIGVGPMQSMKVIHMVGGSPSLSAEFKRGRAQAAGHEIVFEEITNTRCIVRGRRKGETDWLRVTWSMDDAKRAKLDQTDRYRMHPRRMLEARASGELCDLKFSDCSWGLPTTEALEDGVTVDGEIADAADAQPVANGHAGAADKPRTAQRRTRTAPPAAQSAPAAPAQAASAPEDAGGALPPLPGEDEPPPEAPPSGDDPVTNKQLTAIWTTLTKDFSFTDDEKDLARAACGSLSGRGSDLPSTKELTKQDAGTVIDTLAHLKAQAETAGEHPRSLLIALLAEREEGAGGE